MAMHGKAQSAMEYLMTYGWAILIIAVVLAVLFEIGVFNGSAFAPKAPPGSCSVYRPEGPGTTFDINLGGVCNGELPQYVAGFNQFLSSYISTGTSPYLSNTAFTFVAWSNLYIPLSACPSSSMAIIDGGVLHNTELGYGRSGCSHIDFSTANTADVVIDTFDVVPRPYYTWGQYAGVYNGVTITLYVDGYPVNSVNSVQGDVPITGISIGGISGFPAFTLNGLISNVQIYNTSLSSNQITALYDEGIGGAPINLQHLVAWYPLNGNANDSSGNGNNGVPSNVMWDSNWETGYTAP